MAIPQRPGTYHFGKILPLSTYVFYYMIAPHRIWSRNDDENFSLLCQLHLLIYLSSVDPLNSWTTSLITTDHCNAIHFLPARQISITHGMSVIAQWVIVSAIDHTVHSVTTEDRMRNSCFYTIYTRSSSGEHIYREVVEQQLKGWFTKWSYLIYKIYYLKKLTIR